MEFNIDVQDVLKQIKFSDILEYLTESYSTTEILDGIDDITFDKLDNKLIKTNSDLKEMSSLLNQAADKLDTEVDKKHD